MTSRRAGLAFLTMAIVSCTPSTPERPWADQIASERREKDQLFRDGDSSPLPPERRASFAGLSYFALDESYRVPASFAAAPPDTRAVVKMPTSTGQLRDMVRVGQLALTLKGQSLHLSAFMEADEPEADRLFVPFTDLWHARICQKDGQPSLSRYSGCNQVR